MQSCRISFISRPIHKDPEKARFITVFFVLACVLIIAGTEKAAAASPGDCVTKERTDLQKYSAFRVSCMAQHDCEFESSIAHNASALAVLDRTAKRIRACWKKAGLDYKIRIEGPRPKKILIHRFLSKKQGREKCTIAELKPFGLEALTSSFRAQCIGY